MPGGFAIVATVLADIILYFAYKIQVMKKSAYLYDLKDFELNEVSISND